MSRVMRQPPSAIGLKMTTLPILDTALTVDGGVEYLNQCFNLTMSSAQFHLKQLNVCPNQRDGAYWISHLSQTSKLTAAK